LGKRLFLLLNRRGGILPPASGNFYAIKRKQPNNKNEFDVLSAKYPNISADKYVVMPNRVHMIIVVSGGGRQNAAPAISRVINLMKG
jgi:hypothetical protein